MDWITLFNKKDSIKEKKFSKPIFLALSNSDFRKQYTFMKDQCFFGFFRKFLKNLGFDEDKIEYVGRPTDEESESPIRGREMPIDNFNGTVLNSSNGEYSIDVFYTPDKIFMIVNSRSKKHEEITKAIEDLIDWKD